MTFEEALGYVLKSEGGYVDNPHDPGGATNYGITQEVYTDWLRGQHLPPHAVRYISADEVMRIYRTNYADRIMFDNLPAGVNYCVFDEAVNSGPRQAVQELQRIVGVNPDGIMGPGTLEGVQLFPDDATLVDRYCDARLAFLRRLATWHTFGAGWTTRVESVRRNAKAASSVRL